MDTTLTSYEVHHSADQRVPIKSWTRGVPVEEAALQQLVAEATYPEHSWPPDNDPKAQKVWRLVGEVVRDALAGGCDA